MVVFVFYICLRLGFRLIFYFYFKTRLEWRTILYDIDKEMNNRYRMIVIFDRYKNMVCEHMNEHNIFVYSNPK